MKNNLKASISKELIVLILVLILSGMCIASANEYGGINLPEEIPPNGTSINDGLSLYYNTPVATGNGVTYWHIGGWWFNEKEMLKLPSVSLMYGASPYDCSALGECGDSNNVIPVPINYLVPIVFVILAYIIWKQKR